MKKATPKARPDGFKRGPFPKVPDEMRRWSALLEAELLTWPHVSVKAMFGMAAMYRGEAVFALLPVTRSVQATNAFGVKPRPGARPGRKWEFFAIEDDSGLRGALERLGEAYERATP